MRRFHLPLSLAVAAAITLAPSGARAAVTSIFSSGSVCTTGSLVLCDAFTVTFDNVLNQYTLTVTNNVAPSNVSDPGFITGLALFNNTSTNYGFDIVSASPSWTLIDSNTNTSSSACDDVGSSGAVDHTKIVMGDCTNGATTAQTVSIVFTTTTGLTTSLFSSGSILIGGDHVQGVGTCSAKFYSNGTVVTASGTSIAGCVSTTVPEPVSMVLLGSGLLGLALPAARLRRRKKEEEA